MILEHLMSKIKHFVVCPLFMCDVEEMDFEI